MVAPKGIERLAERYEVTGDKPGSLMDQLIERMLAVGSRLTPIDGARLKVDSGFFEGDVFAIALHGQLL